MVDSWIFVVTLATALGAGIIAGVFFIFSVCIMTALSRLLPAHGVAVMQSINVTILNPWFLGVFLGTGVGSLVLGVIAIIDWGAPGSEPLLAGSALYLIGGIMVTGLYNVPRNNQLAELDPVDPNAAEAWRRYVREWTIGNHLRTVMTIAAMLAFVWAIRS